MDGLNGFAAGSGGSSMAQHDETRGQAAMTSGMPAAGRGWSDFAIVVLLAGISPAFLIAISICEPYAGRAMGLPADEVIWFAEAFLIGTLAVMPLSGTLLTRLGFVGLMRIALLGSLMAGGGIVLCDAVFQPPQQAPILVLMLLAGVFSAPFAPAAQAFAIATHEAGERGRAMALWGGGRFAGFLMTAVLAGPLIAIAGWSIPLAVGAAMIVPCVFLLRQPARLPRDAALAIDLRGLMLLLAGLLPLLLVLNLLPLFRGERGDAAIAALLATALVGGVLFVRHTRRCPAPIVPFSPLRHRDFRIATLIAFVVALMTTGQFSILMVGEVANVSSDWLSWRTTAGGIAQILGVILGGHLVRPMIARPATCAALIVTALGLASFNLYGDTVGLATISWTRALMGFGLGLTVPLLAAFAYSGLKSQDTPAASSLFVFAGMIGTGMGVAALGGEFAEALSWFDDTLLAYRIVFWTQVLGVVVLIPLVWLLRLEDVEATRR